MSKPLRKAVFPVAGLGTRFLPATKAMPKEMLTVVDRPVIQYVVDEAREAGIEHFIFVTGRNKSVIEDHFDHQVELENILTAQGKKETLELLRKLQPGPGQASFTRQQIPLGLGHAVWCARELVGNEPFAVILPDMLARSEPGCLTQMIELYNQTGGNVIAVKQVPQDQTGKYGIVGVEQNDNGHFTITDMVEKPAPDTAPSNLMMMGRYILQPEIFDLLGDQQVGSGGEIQLTDAMKRLHKSQPFYSMPFTGKIYDCGDKVGFVTANIAYAMSRPDIGEAVREQLTMLFADPSCNDPEESADPIQESIRRLEMALRAAAS